jgi:hypothetical protein
VKGGVVDFYIDIGFAVLLRLLGERDISPKWRRAFLKLFKGILFTFGEDAEFKQAARLQLN